MVWVALRRPGMSNHGMSPSLASPGSPLYESAIAPSARQTRSRVMAFTMTRSRSIPPSEPLQREGSSP